MGVVYLARQARLIGRAVKLPLRCVFERGALRRFQLEAEAAAGCSIQYLGSTTMRVEGQPYYAMDLSRGNLADLCDGRPLPRRGPRRSCATCPGRSLRPSKGILHRDLKPSNVLIGEDGRPESPTLGWRSGWRILQGNRQRADAGFAQIGDAATC